MWPFSNPGKKLRESLMWTKGGGPKQIAVIIDRTVYSGTLRYGGKEFATIIVQGEGYSVPYDRVASELKHYGHYYL